MFSRTAAKYAFAGRRLPLSKCSRAHSVWANIPDAPPDKILGLTTKFKLDTNPNKINLGVGAYRDENGQPWVLPSVQLAEEMLVENQEKKEYAPILGTPAYIEVVQRLLFGNDPNGLALLADNRVATAQGLSGTGSLRVLAEFLGKFHWNHRIKVPNPTWANHLAIMERSGLVPEYYRYYDYKTNGLDQEGMLEDLSKCDPGTAILLHLCCHNPTGVDLTPAQWDEVVKIVDEKQLVPVVDMAYQGFESGDPIEDLGTLFKFSEAVNTGKLATFVMAQSFAKNMGLYGERIGSLSVITSDSVETTRVNSQLAKVIRPMYSSPPIHGAQIVKAVLDTPEIYEQWLKDVKTMASRLRSMRQLLFDKLTKEYGNPKNWDHLLSQKGMFCYTGLTSDQVQQLLGKSIYLTSDGRISVAGITPSNVDYLAKSIDEVTR